MTYKAYQKIEGFVEFHMQIVDIMIRIVYRIGH